MNIVIPKKFLKRTFRPIFSENRIEIDSNLREKVINDFKALTDKNDIVSNMLITINEHITLKHGYYVDADQKDTVEKLTLEWFKIFNEFCEIIAEKEDYYMFKSICDSLLFKYDLDEIQDSRGSYPSEGSPVASSVFYFMIYLAEYIGESEEYIESYFKLNFDEDSYGKINPMIFKRNIGFTCKQDIVNNLESDTIIALEDRVIGLLSGLKADKIRRFFRRYLDLDSSNWNGYNGTGYNHDYPLSGFNLNQACKRNSDTRIRKYYFDESMKKK